MALFKILKGNSDKLDITSTPFNEGYCYFTKDEQKLYVDYLDDEGNQRRDPIAGSDRVFTLDFDYLVDFEVNDNYTIETYKFLTSSYCSDATDFISNIYTEDYRFFVSIAAGINIPMSLDYSSNGIYYLGCYYSLISAGKPFDCSLTVDNTYIILTLEQKLMLEPGEPYQIVQYNSDGTACNGVDLSTILSSSSTNTDIPSAKAVVDYVNNTTNFNLTTNRVLVSNNSGDIAVSEITSTELNQLDGITSNIQTQLNNKMPKTLSNIEFNSSGSLKNYGGFIDFHYFNSNGEPTDNSGNVVTSTPDYTSRIIEDSAGTISVNNVKMKSGVITGSLSGNATSATKATQDASGNVITSTYETKSDATAKLDTKMDKIDPVGSGTFSFGRLTDSTIGTRSIVLGSDATASGKDTVVLGRKGNATGAYATSIGYGNTASGDNSVVIGVNSKASSGNAMAFGSSAKAQGWNALAIGASTTASGPNSTAIGTSSTASGEKSVALGDHNTASGEYATAMGCWTSAPGTAATSLGNGTTANGWGAMASGIVTNAKGLGQHVFGAYNIPDSNTISEYSDVSDHLIIVGNGDVISDDGVQSNAMTLDWSGNAWFSGDVYVGSTSGTNKDDGSKMLATIDYEFITEADIDEICGASIQAASEVSF